MDERQIRWTEQALLSHENILNFTIDQWNLEEAIELDQKVKRLINQLKSHKNLCPASRKKNLRKCVISKYTSLVYTVVENRIDLITFIDTRGLHNF